MRGILICAAAVAFINANAKTAKVSLTAVHLILVTSWYSARVA
jgi:hypothetical protein